MDADCRRVEITEGNKNNKKKKMAKMNQDKGERRVRMRRQIRNARMQDDLLNGTAYGNSKLNAFAAVTEFSLAVNYIVCYTFKM